ncbi:nucleotide exchange factor GrpE [Candidatus Nitrospira allomarina]|uniref:Protein GrpE n=1 Tax=Candidatus Nitrospira allomarina TaxID=3020900 RepID=A0AA96G9N8_9BACT|nr:nucleotide exchange factor GrpE [Candidatus Nitrospira allomarina]WNM56992.1 nucleotide exchange factor GrpE [Candidatus Nitrospira allomarina]
MSLSSYWSFMTQQSGKGKTMSSTEETTGEVTTEEVSPQEHSNEDTSESASENGGTPEEELQIFRDKYLRLAAEFENYKRRAQRDQSDSIRFGNESLLKNLLPIIDNLERAIQCAKDAGTSGPLLEGVELTHKQFLETVSKVGVRQLNTAGNSFDPAIHQAVTQVESENMKPNTVIEEFQKGYLLHDRILRPAMVSVAKEKSELTEPGSTEESGEEGGIHV